jgi:hypothetical protein
MPLGWGLGGRLWGPLGRPRGWTQATEDPIPELVKHTVKGGLGAWVFRYVTRYARYVTGGL